MPNLIYRFLSSEYCLYVQVFMRLLNGTGIPLHLLILDLCPWEKIKFPCDTKYHDKYLPGLRQQPQTLGPTSSPLLPFTCVCVCVCVCVYRVCVCVSMWVSYSPASVCKMALSDCSQDAKQHWSVTGRVIARIGRWNVGLPPTGDSHILKSKLKTKAALPLFLDFPFQRQLFAPSALFLNVLYQASSYWRLQCGLSWLQNYLGIWW